MPQAQTAISKANPAIDANPVVKKLIKYLSCRLVCFIQDKGSLGRHIPCQPGQVREEAAAVGCLWVAQSSA